MNRSLALLAGILTLSLSGCPEPMQMGGDGASAADMRTTDGGDDPNNVDLAEAEPMRCKGAGCIGAPCRAATDCTEGKAGMAKVCWRETLLNNPRYVPTVDGYCSQECGADTDCGTGYCLRFPAENKSFCVARCRTALTCRHPGYACTFETGAGKDGICFPSQNLDCQPTKGTCEAVVDVAGSKAKGGCIRAAYEDLGVCRVACKVGSKTCPPDYRFGAASAPQQHCVFLNTTVDTAGRPSPFGDKWKGPVCMEYALKQLNPGDRCSFWDECTDGFQCDRLAQPEAKQVCRRLCVQGNGAQDDPGIFVPAGATVFNNMCSNAMEGCADGLGSGQGNGQIGLCVPK